jgi:hypothetical protein
MKSHLPPKTLEEFFENEPRFKLEKKKGHFWLSSASESSSLSASSATKATPAANASKKYVSEQEERVAVKAFFNELEVAIGASEKSFVRLSSSAVGQMRHRPVHIANPKQSRAKCLKMSHLPLETYEDFFAKDPRFKLTHGAVYLTSAAAPLLSSTTTAATTATTTATTTAPMSAAKASPAANTSKTYSSKDEELAAVEVFLDKVEAAVRASDAGSIRFSAVAQMAPMPVHIHIKVNSVKHMKCVESELSHLAPKLLSEFLRDEPRFVFKKSVIYLSRLRKKYDSEQSF